MQPENFSILPLDPQGDRAEVESDAQAKLLRPKLGPSGQQTDGFGPLTTKYLCAWYDQPGRDSGD